MINKKKLIKNWHRKKILNSIYILIEFILIGSILILTMTNNVVAFHHQRITSRENITVSKINSPLPAIPQIDINKPILLGDFETGNTSQWTQECSAGRSDNINIVTYPVRQGIFSGRFRVYNGDRACGGERAEVSKITNETEGSDLYYAWSTMFPLDWVDDTDWGTIFNQWHDFNDRNPSLSFVLDNMDDNIYVNECAGNVTDNSECGGYQPSEIKIADISKGLWHDFILHVKWSTTNSGQIEIWHKLENQSNFTKVLSSTGHPTLQYKSGNPAGNATITTYQMGLYRGVNQNQPTQTIYEDGYRVGNTFDSMLYYTNISPGDINGDGNITVADALLYLR